MLTDQQHRSKRRSIRSIVFAEAAALCLMSSTAMAALVDSGAVNIAIPDTIAGIYFNVVTGVSGVTTASVPGWDIGPYSSAAGQFALWGPTVNTWFNPQAIAGGNYNLPAGTMIQGAAAAFFRPGNVVSQFTLNSSQNYLGFRFVNEANANAVHFGYIQVQFGATGATRSIIRYVYDNVANTAVTIPGGPANVAPVVAVAATTLTAGAGSVTPTITTPRVGTGSTAFACTIPANAPSNFLITSNASQNITTTTAAIGLSCVRQAAVATATLTCTQTGMPGPNPANATATITCPALIPNINVTPASLTASAPVNQTTSAMLTIGNTGQGTLNWSITEEPVPRPQSTPTGRGGPSEARDEFVATNKPEGPSSVSAPISGPIWRAPEALLYNNGPLVTNPGAGAGGANVSALQLTQTTFAFGHSVTSGLRVADDFVVGGSGWLINTVTFFAYQSFSPGTTSTINAVNVRIWNGPPGTMGSAVVFGDTTTNRLASSTYSGINRTVGATLTNPDRPIMANVVTINTFLPAGTYWFDWQTGGTLASGPWAPPVTLAGQLGKPGANALQFDTVLMTWNPATDTGAATVQDLPFVIDGLSDCASPSNVPWLSLGQTAGSNTAGTSTPVTVSFDATGLAAGTYNARLCASSNDPDVGPGNGTGLVIVPVSFDVIASVDMVATLTDSPDPVNAGANLTYTATATNAGPSAATGVTVSLPLPTGTTLVSATASAGGTCVGTNCTWAGATANGIARTVTIVASVPANTAAGTVFSATVTVDAVENDPQPANDSVIVTTTVSTSADVSVTITDAPDPVTAGTNLTYTLTVANAGPSDAANVTVAMVAPAGTTLVSGPGPIGTLAAGGSLQNIYVFAVSPAVLTGTIITGTATVASTTADGTPGNNSASTTTAVITLADVSVTITDAPDPVTAGTNLTYTVTVSNAGPSDAANVTAAMVAPTGTTLVSGPGAIGTLAAGASLQSTFVFTVSPAVLTGTIITGTATVASTTPDMNAVNNSASTTTAVVTLADLRLISLVPSATTTNVNVPVTFTATSRNFGPSDAQNVVVSITLSPDFRYTSHTATGATCTTPQVGLSGVITCTWAGATAPNATRVLSVTAFSNNNSLNTVSANTSSPTPDPTANNNAAAVTVTVGLVIQGIPTLDRAALLLLGLLLALGGLIAVRRNS